jgi:hypothetical protein
MGNVEYHRVLAGDRRRIGRGILAIVLLLGGLLVFTVVLSVGAAALDDRGSDGSYIPLIFRVVGSWTRGSRSGLVLGLIVMAVTFAASHAASDPWLNLWYVVLAVGTGLIAWRTGGLEIAIVLHALWNTLGFVFSAALRSDLNSVVTARDAGAATAATLIPSAVVLVTVVIVWFTTRRTGPLTADAPQVTQVAQAAPSRSEPHMTIQTAGAVSACGRFCRTPPARPTSRNDEGPGLSVEAGPFT